MSNNRASEYRQMIEDVVAHPDLAEPDEWMHLRDVVARIERRLLANLPAQPAGEAAE